MVSGGIVELDSTTGQTFFLPPHRRSALTGGSLGSDDMTEYACGIPVLMKDFHQMPGAMKIGAKGTTGKAGEIHIIYIHSEGFRKGSLLFPSADSNFSGPE